MPPNVANLFGFMATQMVAQMAPSACAQTGRTWHQQGGRSWCDSRRFAALPRHVEAPPVIEPLPESKIVQTVPVVPEPPAVQPEPLAQPPAPPPSSPYAKELPNCDNRGGEETLARITRAIKVLDTRDVRSDKPTYMRWCRSLAVASNSGFYDVVYHVYHIMWTSSTEGRFFVRVEAQRPYSNY